MFVNLLTVILHFASFMRHLKHKDLKDKKIAQLSLAAFNIGVNKLVP